MNSAFPRFLTSLTALAVLWLSSMSCLAGAFPMAAGASCASPAWSPTGTKIAFTCDPGGGTQNIYVINADGTGLQQLTSGDASDDRPCWSPDGAKIAFDSDRSEFSQVYVMNADGTGLTQLTHEKYGAGQPAWSPDGLKIAISTTRAHPSNPDIMLITPSGADIGWLTTSSDAEGQPAWSPNGQTIAYATETGIWRRNVDKSGLSRLTARGPNGKWIDGQPTWSPSGDRIAFPSMRIDEGEDGDLIMVGTRVYVMNSDGTSQNPLFQAEPVGVSTCPAWSPVADRLAFAGRVPGANGRAIYIVNSDGTGLTQVTHQAAAPTFSPEGGEYSSPQDVTITCVTGSAVIRYTTDGSEPTESSTQYTDPVSISLTATLSAKAWKADYFPSITASAMYAFKTATPAFDPDGGTYSGTQNVTVTCSTPNVTIRYTTDSTDPSENSTEYTGPVAVSVSGTLKAKAFRTGWTESDMKSADYTIQ